MPLERRPRRFRGSNNSSSSSSSSSSGVSALRVLKFLSVVPCAGLKRDPVPCDTSKAGEEGGGGGGVYYATEERKRSIANSIRDAFVGLVEGRGARNDDKDDDDVTTTLDGDFDSSRSTIVDSTASLQPVDADEFGGETIGTAISTPRRDSGSLNDDHLLRAPSPRARLRRLSRSVSFNEVVKEVFIETRQQRYGDLATKREAFYSHAELAVFKRAWVWHIRMSDWPMDGLMRCGCPCCDADSTQDDQRHDNIQDNQHHQEEEEENVSVVRAAHVGFAGVVVRSNDTLLRRDYSKWTWEG